MTQQPERTATLLIGHRSDLSDDDKNYLHRELRQLRGQESLLLNQRRLLREMEVPLLQQGKLRCCCSGTLLDHA